jgi:hypothetical protein
VAVSVKDDLLDDFPSVYPGLERSEIERLLTLLDEGASTEGSLSLSIATALKPLVPDVADRIASYPKSGDVDDYVRMLRGAAVVLLQEWQPDGPPPAPDTISSAVEG